MSKKEGKGNRNLPIARRLAYLQSVSSRAAVDHTNVALILHVIAWPRDPTRTRMHLQVYTAYWRNKNEPHLQCLTAYCVLRDTRLCGDRESCRRPCCACHTRVVGEHNVLAVHVSEAAAAGKGLVVVVVRNIHIAETPIINKTGLQLFLYYGVNLRGRKKKHIERRETRQDKTRQDKTRQRTAPDVARAAAGRA